MPIFEPPTTNGVPWVRDASQPGYHLFRHYGPVVTGQTVYYDGSTWHIRTSPDMNTLAAAATVYQGGHCHVISTRAAGIPVPYPDSLAGGGYTTVDHSAVTDVAVDKYTEAC